MPLWLRENVRNLDFESQAEFFKLIRSPLLGLEYRDFRLVCQPINSLMLLWVSFIDPITGSRPLLPFSFSLKHVGFHRPSDIVEGYSV